MTHIYRVVAHSKPLYFGDRLTVDRAAQALADETGETMIIERCQLIDRSPTGVACAFLNGDEWCATHRTLRYVKPRWRTVDQLEALDRATR